MLSAKLQDSLTVLSRGCHCTVDRPSSWELELLADAELKLLIFLVTTRHNSLPHRVTQLILSSWVMMIRSAHGSWCMHHICASWHCKAEHMLMLRINLEITC